MFIPSTWMNMPDQDGRIAPETWEFGFGHAFNKFFIENVLRPPEKQVHLLSDETLADYDKILADLGGADITYVGARVDGAHRLRGPGCPRIRRWLAGGMENARNADLHAKPVYHRAEFAARLLWCERGSYGRSAQGGRRRTPRKSLRPSTGSRCTASSEGVSSPGSASPRGFVCTVRSLPLCRNLSCRPRAPTFGFPRPQQPISKPAGISATDESGKYGCRKFLRTACWVRPNGYHAVESLFSRRISTCRTDLHRHA